MPGGDAPILSYCDIAPGDPWHGPYHEREYGFPIGDEPALFERLVLEINLAGLSWLTILKKREAFRKAYHEFDVDRVAHLDDERSDQATGLRKGLREVLESDEYVEALAPHLEQAEVKAIRLLAPRRPDPVPDPPVPKKGDEQKTDGKANNWKTVNTGQSEVTREGWVAEAARLAKMLEEGPGRYRLTLSWRLEREEGSPG